MNNKNAIYLIILVLLTSAPIYIHGQDRQDKTISIINKLKFVENQKLDIIDFKIKPLKYQATGNDSLKLVELEMQLTEEELLKRIIDAFNEVFTEDEINDIYRFIQTTAFDKFFNSEKIYKAISTQFVDINKELEKISTNLNGNIKKSAFKFEPIPIDREDGFYETIDYNSSSENKDIKLEDKPSLTKYDILKIKKSYDNNDKVYIDITLTKDGARKFYILTKNNISKPIAIVIEKQIVSLPIVHSEILGGKASISGDFSEKEIENMIKKLKEK